jgi:hypothetical protein
MTRAEHLPRLRGALLCVVALVVLAFAVALLAIGLLGIALLIAGVLSWLHPVDVASAWARTLAGIGLIGGSTALAALGWLALGGMAPLLGDVARLRYRALSPASRTLRFVAVIGILLALICLPFAAAIRVTAHGPWLGA